MNDDLAGTIADTLAIQKVKATYCMAADAVVREPDRSKATLTSLFMPDASADYGVATCDGSEELLGYLVHAISDNNEWLFHHIGTPIIEINGDTAKGDWTLIVQMKQKHLDGKEQLIGRYSDEFVRTAEGWKITSIRFVEEGVYKLIDVTSQPPA